MNKFLLLIIVLLFLNPNVVLTQKIEIQIYKVLCDKQSGSNLEVEVRKSGELLDSGKNYDYTFRSRLPDSTKIRIIEEIFKFTSDTSRCCREVNMYENHDYTGCFIEWPMTKRFSIQIEALFIINRIAYYPLTFRIGCYPVLYDTVTRKEINENSCLVDIMVEHYKNWFNEYKRTGILPDYRFLNEGRIKWWGKHLR